MPDIDSGVQIVPLEGSRLTAQLVAQLTQTLQKERTGRSVVIDASQLTNVDPDGLSALMECAHAWRAPLALAGLSRALMRIALEAGLARHFTIFASVDAFTRAHARAQAEAQPELQRCAL